MIRDSLFNDGKGAVAMDELIEIKNDRDKEMMRSDDDAGHIKKSLFMSLFRRAANNEIDV